MVISYIKGNIFIQRQSLWAKGRPGKMFEVERQMQLNVGASFPPFTRSGLARLLLLPDHAFGFSLSVDHRNSLLIQLLS